MTIVQTKNFKFRLPLTPQFTDLVVGQSVIEMQCSNLKTLINRFKTVISFYGGAEVTAVSHRTQQKHQHLALQ